MKTIAFAPVVRSRQTMVASYVRPANGARYVLRVEGWLTLEAADGTRHVVAAVPDRQTGTLVPALDLTVDGWELDVRLEVWGPS